MLSEVFEVEYPVTCQPACTCLCASREAWLLCGRLHGSCGELHRKKRRRGAMPAAGHQRRLQHKRRVRLSKVTHFAVYNKSLLSDNLCHGDDCALCFVSPPEYWSGEADKSVWTRRLSRCKADSRLCGNVHTQAQTVCYRLLCLMHPQSFKSWLKQSSWGQSKNDLLLLNIVDTIWN